MKKSFYLILVLVILVLIILIASQPGWWQEFAEQESAFLIDTVNSSIRSLGDALLSTFRGFGWN